MKCQVFLMFLIIATVHGDGQVYCGRRLAVALAYLCNEERTEKRAQPGIKIQEFLGDKKNLQLLEADDQITKRKGTKEDLQKQLDIIDQGNQQFLLKNKENQDFLFENEDKEQSLDFLDVEEPIYISKRAKLSNFALNQKQNVWMQPHLAKSLSRGKRQIISECCEKSCTIEEMLTYCPE